MRHHKKQMLILKHKHKLALLRRLLNKNSLGSSFQWTTKTQDQYEKHCTELSEVISLIWECSSLSKTVDFLELNVSTAYSTKTVWDLHSNGRQKLKINMRSTALNSARSYHLSGNVLHSEKQ